MNRLYAEERRGEKLQDLAVRREERRRFREEELEASAAAIQQQREHHAAERKFLHDYVSAALHDADEQQVWAAGSAQRQVNMNAEQGALQTELLATQRMLTDEQALLHRTRSAHRQHEATAAQAYRDSAVQLADLQGRLQRATAECQAAQELLPRLRRSLQDEQASVKAEVLVAQMRQRGWEEVQSEANSLREQTAACRSNQEVVGEEICAEAAEHKQLAAWERTLLEAHSAESTLKLEAFERRQALARRAGQPHLQRLEPRQLAGRLERLLP